MISISCLFWGASSALSQPGPPANRQSFPQPGASLPWQEGERLTYSASWADVVAAAEVKFEAAGRHLIAGHETRRVSIRARTVGMVDKWIFPGGRSLRVFPRPCLLSSRSSEKHPGTRKEERVQFG